MRPSRNQALIDALATELKVRRQELGLSQVQLAGACDIDSAFVSLIEVGKKQPTISTLLILSDGLQMPMHEFVERVERRFRAGQKEAKAASTAKAPKPSKDA